MCIRDSYQAENLAAGDSIVVLIRGTLNKTVSGAIINTAAVTSSTPDPDPTNNTATEKTSVEDTADLSITKLAHPNPAVQMCIRDRAHHASHRRSDHRCIPPARPSV